MPKKSLFDDEAKLREAVAQSTCQADVLRLFGVTAVARGSGNFRTLQRKLQKYNIDTSHFDPHANRRKSLDQQVSLKRIPLEDVLSGKTPWHGGSNLKSRLIKEMYLVPECSACGQGETWNGHPLTLQLDHIDGDHQNNRIGNLRLLCPNCHSQTSTFSRKKWN